MDSPLTASLQSARRTGVSPKLAVAVIYECMDTGKRAKRFSDQLAVELTANRGLDLNLWNFWVLGLREARNAAASTAATADLVIFSMDGRNPLPVRLEKWIEMWLWLIDGHKPAVAVLFAAPDAESAPVQTYLRRGAANKRLDFFSRANCAFSEIQDSHELSARGRRAIVR